MALPLCCAIAACEPSEFRPVPVPAGGGGYSAPAQPAQRPLAPGAHKTLNDPEKEEWVTDEEPILADTPKEAEAKCRQLAASRGLGLTGIRSPRSQNGKRYVCQFGGYVEKQ
jgi:hypothetical protein